MTQTPDYVIVEMTEGMTIPLGIQGENNVREISFAAGELLYHYPGGTLTIECIRPNETGIYIADTYMMGEWLMWKVNSYDTHIAGSGTFQIRLVNEVGEVVKLTPIFRTSITRSQPGMVSPDVPRPVPSWVEELLAAVSIPLIEIDATEITGQGSGYVNLTLTEAHAEAIRNAKFGFDIKCESMFDDATFRFTKAYEDGAEMDFNAINSLSQVLFFYLYVDTGEAELSIPE